MRERLNRVWPSLVALAGTVGVVIALLVLFGDKTGEPGDDVAAGTENGATADPDGTAEPDDDPTSTPGDETGDDATDESGAETGDESGDETGDEATPAPPELRTPVGIANQTAVEGLELRAQERIEAGGWEVAATSGFDGVVPETTVYYPPGLEESAEALSRQFPEIARVQPSFENLNQSRLVIVLVDDYIDVVDG